MLSNEEIALQVIGMLEKRVGEEAFRKLLERIVGVACESGSKGGPLLHFFLTSEVSK